MSPRGPFVAPPEQTFPGVGSSGISSPLPQSFMFQGLLILAPTLPSPWFLRWVNIGLPLHRPPQREGEESGVRPHFTATFHSAGSPWVQSPLDLPCLHAEKSEKSYKTRKRAFGDYSDVLRAPPQPSASQESLNLASVGAPR